VAYALQRKLNIETQRHWTKSIPPDSDLPTYVDLRQFIAGWVSSLRLLPSNAMASVRDQSTSNCAKKQATKTPKRGNAAVHIMMARGEKECPNCEDAHHLSQCKRFMKLQPWGGGRFRGFKACFRCLEVGHRMESCQAKNRCKRCQGGHHILLHLASREGAGKIDQSSGSEAVSENTSPKNTILQNANPEERPAGPPTMTCHVEAPRKVLMSRTKTKVYL